MERVSNGNCNSRYWGMLSENISDIVNGTIEPLTDGEVAELLTEFKDIAESSIDTESDKF